MLTCSPLQMPRVTVDSLLRQLTVDASENSTTPPYVLRATSPLPPDFAPSSAPWFNTFYAQQNSSVLLRLPGLEPENQQLTAKIIQYPQHGKLYNVDGTLLSPNPSLLSESVIAQFVREVVDFSSQYQPSWSYSDGSNITFDGSGNLPRNVTACYCKYGLVGQPDCELVNADCDTAWSPDSWGGRSEFVTVRFELAVHVSEVRMALCSGRLRGVGGFEWGDCRLHSKTQSYSVPGTQAIISVTRAVLVLV